MFLTNTTKSFFNGLLAVVYPQACAVCGDSVENHQLGIACESCWMESRMFTCEDTICWKCGALSTATISPDKKQAIGCRRCDADAYTAARACGAYEGALRASILALKHEPRISVRLKQMLIRTQMQPPLSSATRVMPVPLHPRREKSRGFNQAVVIANVIAEAASLPMDSGSLVRTSHSEVHRAGLDAKGRRETVAAAFTVRNPRLISGEKILLVDDVFTTGATVSACAAALRSEGASEVYVLTIARALH